MNKSQVFYFLTILYSIVFVIMIIASNYNILLSLIVVMTLMVTFFPYILGNYIRKHELKVNKLKIKFGCYKAIKLCFKINFFVFFAIFIQLSLNVLKQSWSEYILIGLAIGPLIIINFVFLFFRNVCVENMYKESKKE